ncbi:MAG: membrane or secreted protein [Bacteroidota bacterium]
MKNNFATLLCLCTALFVANSSFTKNSVMADELHGAWMHQSGNEEHLLQFIGGYTTHTVFNKAGKQFIETRGGTYTINGGKVKMVLEFDTKDKEQTGQTLVNDFLVKDNELTMDINGKKLSYKKIDNGAAPLTGVWHITGRMQEGKLVPIHRTGTRKTLKILSGTRFQWVAIDPGVKQFSGTGGGVYQFANGKYTEHIEFFSRDSSRVGASLSFDGKLESGQWHHSGLSSKGDKIYEVWEKVKQ